MTLTFRISFNGLKTRLSLPFVPGCRYKLAKFFSFFFVPDLSPAARQSSIIPVESRFRSDRVADYLPTDWGPRCVSCCVGQGVQPDVEKRRKVVKACEVSMWRGAGLVLLLMATSVVKL